MDDERMEPVGSEDEELDNIIEMTDEDGNEVSFEFLDLIEYEGKEYVFLCEPDGNEVIILEVHAISEDEEEYVAVEDEQVLEAVYNVFKEKYKDEFNFTDE